MKILRSINRAYVLNLSGPDVAVLDISNPASPAELGEYICTADCSGQSSKLDVVNGNAYLACGEGGLRILNVNTPSAITLRSTYTLGMGYVKAIAANTTHAFAQSLNWGMRVVDVTNPSNPQPRGADSLNAQGYGIEVEDNLAYLANVCKGLRILDISDPMQPLLRGIYGGEHATPASCITGVARYGGLTYVTGSWSDGFMRIVDTFNPSNPTVRGEVSLGAGGWPNGMAVSGNYAYVANSGNGMTIVNVANVAAPVVVTTLSTPSSAQSVGVLGCRVYVACWPNVLTVNVENPLAPFVEHTYSSLHAQHIQIKDQLASVSALTGVEVLDLSNPAAGPTPVASYDTPGSAWQTAVVDNRVFVADGDCGLAILELRDVQPPTVTITYPTFSTTWTTTSAFVELSGVASDNAGVTQVSWSNHRGGSGVAEDWGNWESWYIETVNLHPGLNVITITATDVEGNIGSDVISVTYSAPPDTEHPQVVIASPATSPYTSSIGTIAVSGTASDNVALSQVTWSNNRGGSGNATGTSSWVVPSITLRGGENVITITAIDTSGNLGTTVLTVVYPDADGDGVGDDVDACPGTVPGMLVDAEGCPPLIPGDFDRDGDVDQADLVTFLACTTGPGIAQLVPECASAKLDEGDDVDQVDFGIFQRCFSGEGRAANPSCAE